MASLKNKTFTSLYDFENDVLSDDYCYKNFETWKFKGKTSKDSVFKYQASVKVDEKGPGVNGKLDDKLSFQFPFLEKYLIWFGIKRSGDMKVHADLGDHEIKDKKFNFFANLKMDTKYSKFAFRLGTNYFGKKCESNTRVETNCCSSGICLTQRNLIRNKKFFFGWVGTFSLVNFCPCRYNAVVGYECKDFDFYLKHVAPECQINCCQSGKCGFKPGVVNAAVNYRVNDKNEVAAEYEKNFGDGGCCLQVGCETKVNDKLKVKGKIDCNFNLSLASKYKLSDILTLTFSSKFALKEGTKCINFDKVLPLPLGFQFEFNI